MANVKRIEGKKGVTYKITVSMGRDAMGQQKRHYKTWKPSADMTARQIERELKRVAYEFERDILTGFQADNRQTFAEYANYVYSLRQQKGDKPQTLALVRARTERINEFIGHIKLTDLRPHHLNAMYKALSQPGASRWCVYVMPAVDFRELVGSGTQGDLAEKCGVYRRLISRLCNNQPISRKNAAIIEKNLGRKDLFYLIGNDKPIGATTIRNYHSIVSVVLEQAEKEMIIFFNPAKRVTLPKKKNVRTVKSLEPQQVRDILTALENENIYIRTLFNMYIVTGCRRGEMLALKWSKVNFENQEIKIDRSTNYLPNHGVYEDATKTENIRFISIPKETTELLKKYRAWQIERRLLLGDYWHDNDLVFPGENGDPLYPATVNRLLSAFCEKYGFPHIHPHVFRHTAASILISSGIDVLTVSKMLGHVDANTTIEVYSHAIEAARRKTADCISETLLNGIK